MKKHLAFLLVFCTTLVFSQSDVKADFDFELQNKGSFSSWYSFGSTDYLVSADSIQTYNGKYSAALSYQGTNYDYKAIGYTLPQNYAGKTITVSAYIKTENVKNGYAGIWIRIDPNIAIDNMSNAGIKGTTDWKKHELTLELSPENTTQIALGGLLVGSGKMWIDQLRVSIDGVDVTQAKVFQKQKFPADYDQSFDSGSNIQSIPTDEITIARLEKLGLIWGFLKYYHPNCASGNYQMDIELLRVLPKVLQTQGSAEFNACLSNWVRSFGTIEKRKKNGLRDSQVKILPDFSWFTSSGFSLELITLLQEIESAERTQKHYNVDFYPEVGNPRFTNERDYEEMLHPDAGFRLVSLFRYWNMVQYFFPYKYAIDENWQAVLKTFIPKFLNAKNETEYTIAVLQLITQIQDTHATLLNKSEVLNTYFGARYAVAKVAFVENRAVVADFYDDELGAKSGLKRGDVIAKIDGKLVDNIVNERLSVTPASNLPTKLRNIATNLLRTNETKMRLEIVRKGKWESIEVSTFSPTEIDVYGRLNKVDTCFKWIDTDVAYLNNGSLKRAYLPKIWQEIRKSKALIIDARNYPSDFPLEVLSRYLLPKKIAFAKFTNTNLKRPGTFTFTKPMFTGIRNRDYYKGKVIILVNEQTQSSAEFHAMAYQTHPNAIIVGTTTAAADGNVSNLVLPGGIYSSFTGIGVYYPDGRETQRIGIVPDVDVKPTVQDIEAGRDTILEKAIEIAKNR
ncbi:S41 family peptidase [Flavobacterium sp.]|uniref:S41 family peptidase n=1 Tax=Flavobacterium sp. TaxID=239 RepID=UPI003B9A484F